MKKLESLEEKLMQTCKLLKLIRVDELTEAELIEFIDLYEPYQLDHAYNVGDVFKYEEKLYKVIQPHTKSRRLAAK